KYVAHRLDAFVLCQWQLVDFCFVQMFENIVGFHIIIHFEMPAHEIQKCKKSDQRPQDQNPFGGTRRSSKRPQSEEKDKAAQQDDETEFTDEQQKWLIVVAEKKQQHQQDDACDDRHYFLFSSSVPIVF